MSAFDNATLMALIWRMVFHHPILSSEIGWENTVIFEKHWRRTSKMMHCGGI